MRPTPVSAGFNYPFLVWPGERGQDLELEAASTAEPALLALTGGHFEALRTGNVAIIGTHGGVADDLLYVKISKLASILSGSTPAGNGTVRWNEP